MSDMPEPTWPIGFYAPGSYACTCALCGKQHIAAKRAVHCADCTIQACWATITQLRADLDAANERAEKAERERDAIHEQVRDMLADQECACGYDKPTDVCLGHLPFHRKTVARAEAAEADAAALRAQVEKAAGRLMWCAGILPTEGARDLASGWAYEARAALAPAMPEGE